ncbi:iron-containing alcohol dehydrogenase [Meira miltonrushii]|uniref:Iron-containing alcohol dehydrogenase n=1 Tax=Meira miltonrushii TaxID=1280837 RepID=A0A316VN39_9BASI|nr:iron-containing alcohol dehydrogenase [Meira miltonrushii]PWN36975.1 iron-containing alcohol dehydrogenase [Meira miltonrushii]
MQPFVYNALPARVIFGWDTSEQVADEVLRLGCKRAIVLTTAQQVSSGQKVLKDLGDLGVGIYSNATMHTPIHITLDALKVAQELQADVCVAVGGGSTIGLGKALALHSSNEKKLKQIAIPTTYAGSEATPIIGQTEIDKEAKSLKTTQRTLNVLPDVIIYDINLTLTLPTQMTTTSGLNAIAHAVEALWAPEANPIISNLALQGIKAISQSFPLIRKDPKDPKGRSNALFGAWSCGTCLGAVGMSLHHKLCHTLGGTFGMPHAETHAIILPHAVAYNAPFATDEVEEIRIALNLQQGISAAQGLFDVLENNNIPCSLKELGFKQEDLRRAAEIAVRSPYPNPAPLEEEKIFHLLSNAYHGIRPAI